MMNIKCLIKAIINIPDTIKQKVTLNRTQLTNSSLIPVFLKILITSVTKNKKK